jgi:hypothetical protein
MTACVTQLSQSGWVSFAGNYVGMVRKFGHLALEACDLQLLRLHPSLGGGDASCGRFHPNCTTPHP